MRSTIAWDPSTRKKRSSPRAAPPGATLRYRDRSVAILTALICQGVLGERLDAHLERAVNNGVDQHVLEVLMVLLSLYADQARTSVAPLPQLVTS